MLVNMKTYVYNTTCNFILQFLTDSVKFIFCLSPEISSPRVLIGLFLWGGPDIFPPVHGPAPHCPHTHPTIVTNPSPLPGSATKQSSPRSNWWPRWWLRAREAGVFTTETGEWVWPAGGVWGGWCGVGALSITGSYLSDCISSGKEDSISKCYYCTHRLVV